MAKNNFDIDAIIARGITNLDTNTSTTPTGSETWTEYGVRNIAKLPAQAYKLARSGLGLGNLAELGARKLGAPQAVKTGLEYALPTSGQAEKEAEAAYKKVVSPETAQYLTESRPEDWGAEFLATELPFIVASGGLGSLKGFGRAALSSAGLLGGAIGGQKLGGEVGEYLGDREVGEVLGGIAGGTTGLKAAHRITNIPSATIGHKIEPLERAKFEKNRLQKLSELEKEYGPKIKELSDVELAAALQGAREKDIFEATKKNKIREVRDEIKAYDHRIEDLKKRYESDYKKAPHQKSIDERTDLYNRADKNKLEYERLKDERSKFVQDRKEKIRDISSEKISAERQAVLEHEYSKIKEVLQSTKKEYKEAVNALGKDSYEKFVKSRDAQERFAEQVAGAATQGANKVGIAGLIGLLGNLKFGNIAKGGLSALATSFANRFFDEVSLAKKVMKEHPELYKEYADIIKNADKWNADRLLLSINTLGNKIEGYENQKGSAKSVDLESLGLGKLLKI